MMRTFVTAVMLSVSVSAASAACREDLVATSQTLKRTREGVESAEKGTAAAVKCTAYRQHIASLKQVRTVFARCDTSADKAKNDAQVAGTIATATKAMQANCAAKN